MKKSTVAPKKNSSTSQNHFFSPQNSFFNGVQKKEEPFFNTKPENPFFQKNVVQAKSNDVIAAPQTTFSNKKNHNGLPNNLKSASEKISGFDMSDVKVHYNSSKPSKIGAFAFAQGNNIHLSSGQEKHLPHETWHVVQQKQGRVNPSDVQYKNTSINNDSKLEREADIMGNKLTSDNAISDSSNLPTLEIGAKQNVIQRKKVPTNFGEFETTKFDEADGRGVEIILKFHPDESKVDAKKIALSQSVKTTDKNGNQYALDPNISDKMVSSGKSGAGYYIDTFSDTNNPLYGERNKLGASQDLKDTPQSANTTSDPVNLGVNTNYETGFCYKKTAKDTSKSKHPASLWDKPRGGKNKGESKMFETAALATDGVDKDKYYGSVKWGYKMEGTDASPTVTKFDITEASKGVPTSNFNEPAKLWNAAKIRGKLVVKADPEATAYDAGDLSKTVKIAKGEKLRQISTHFLNSDPAVKAELLKADGTGSGKIYFIKNSDLADDGSGLANKKLPTS